MLRLMHAWEEQWKRVNRYLDRVETIYSGRTQGGTEDVRDDLYAFFQNAHHLKDWLTNDPSVTSLPKRDIEAFISRTECLRICADLSNGTKHLILNSTRTRDPSTAVTKTHVTVYGRTAFETRRPDGALEHLQVPAEPQIISYAFTVESGGREYDALALSRDIVEHWRRWVEQSNLL